MSCFWLTQVLPNPAEDLPCIIAVQHGLRQRRKHPIAKLTLVFVTVYVIGLMRTGPNLAVNMVMRVFTVVMVVGASRHHVAELVRHLQPHNQHPDRHQRDGRRKGETGWTLVNHGVKVRPVQRADGSEKCKHEEIVILSQLEMLTLHLPVFLSNAT